MDVFLNGRWLAPSKALVPALNSMSLFGESVYEGIPLYGGKPLFLREHLRRFEQGARFLGWKGPGKGEVLRVLEGFARRWGGRRDLIVRLGLLQDMGDRPSPRTFSRASPLLFANARGLRHDPGSPVPPRGRVGIGRWRLPSPSAYPYGFKTAFFLTARRDMARHPEWEEMLRLSEGGKVVDGFSSSPLLFHGRTVFAGSPSSGGLESVTKEKVLRICHAKGLRVSTRPWGLQDVRKGGELILVGSGVGILSPSSLDGRSLGPVGPHARWLWEEFRGWISGLSSTKVGPIV
jgi:D-alanine transaminase